MNPPGSALSRAYAAAPPRAPQFAVAGVGALVLLVGALFLAADGWQRGVLFVFGGLLGVTLYHAAFGFTSAYRRAFAKRDVAGVGAQLVMLALAMLLFAPILAQGQALGHGVVGAVAPVAVQVAVGSVMFGLGMQLGGGCGSGTLYTVGGGSVRMVLTLIAFCFGGFWASLDMGFWARLPSWGSISLARSFGWEAALPLQLGLLALVWLLLRRWARGAEQGPFWDGRLDWRRLAFGPWPLLLGGVLLAVLNWATLVVAGHPWTITWGFTLWGAKAAGGGGLGPVDEPVLERRLPRDRAREKRDRGHHVADEPGNRARRARRRRPRRTVRARVANPVALGGRRRRGRAVDGLRRAPRLRLQHRRLLQRGRVHQPARLAVDRLRPCGHVGRRAATPLLRARGGAGGTRPRLSDAAEFPLRSRPQRAMPPSLPRSVIRAQMGNPG